MKVLDDIDSFISSTFGDRISTPLYSSIAISWALWNWRILYITFILTGDSVPWPHSNKLEYVHQFLNWCDGFIFPLISAAAFIFVLPYAANYTHKTSLKFRKTRMENKANIIDKDRSFTRKQVDDIIEGYTERAKSLEAEVVSFQRQVKVANEAIQSRVKEATDFKIISGKYGIYGAWVDVTSDLMKPPEKLFGFQVSNNSFTNEDPAPLDWKQLIITYQNEEGILSIIANEGDSVSFNKETNTILVTGGSRTEQWKSRGLSTNFTKEMLVGVWKNEWTPIGETVRSEEFRIDSDMRYLFLDGRHQFDIQDIRINQEQKVIEFTKVGAQPDDKRRLINSLQIQTSKLLTGTENTGSTHHDIKYTKID